MFTVNDIVPLRYNNETLGFRVVVIDASGVDYWFDIDYLDFYKAGVTDEVISSLGLDLMFNRASGMYETENEKDSTVILKTLESSDSSDFWGNIDNSYHLSVPFFNINRLAGDKEASMVLLTCRWVFGTHFIHSQVFRCAVKLHGEKQVNAIKSVLPSKLNKNWAQKVDEVVEDGSLWLTVELNSVDINDLVNKGIFIPALSPSGLRVLCVDRSRGSSHAFSIPEPDSSTTTSFDILSKSQECRKGYISEVFGFLQDSSVFTGKIPNDFISRYMGGS